MKREVALIGGLLMVGALFGCHSSPPSRFYTLRSTAPAGPTQYAAPYSVVVGPVTVPAIVDRPQIVVYRDANQVTLAEQSRWADPLDSAIPRTIAGDLSNLLDGARVAAASPGAPADPDYRVSLDVQRFEPVMGRSATVEVLWTVRASKGDGKKTGRSSAQETVTGSDYDGIVSALDRALAAVSGEIAAAIRSIATTG
jgi:uncharacterized protein